MSIWVTVEPNRARTATLWRRNERGHYEYTVTTDRGHSCVQPVTNSGASSERAAWSAYNEEQDRIQDAAIRDELIDRGEYYEE